MIQLERGGGGRALGLVVVLALGARAHAGSPRPDLVLITLDTTRADRLGAYGWPEPLTPHMDRLTRRGVAFEEAFGSVPITMPSHTTMLTGQYPFRTGVRDNGLSRLDAKADTLPALLREVGYHTRAYVSSAVLDRAFGLDRGFEHYDDELRAMARPEERTASEVDARVAADLPALGRPFFLWVHYYDPHLPYAPPPPFDHLSPGGLGAYAGEIASMDAGVGRLLRHLRARKLLDGAVVLVAGDHGEGLGDHGESSHGVLLYDPALHVPMILASPGAPGSCVRGLARLVDVAPTLADFAGARPPRGADGITLRAAAQAGVTAERDVYQESWMPANSFGWSPLFALRQPDWHLVRGAGVEIYDVRSDPLESRDRAQDPAAPLASMMRTLDAWGGAPPASPAAPSAELREKLQSLGYVSSAGEKGGTLDPRKGLPLLEKMAEAKELMARSAFDRAIALLADVVRVNSENVVARNDLATCYMRSNRPKEAARELSAALAVRDLDFLEVNLGKALQAQNLVEPARQSYLRALAKSPRFAEGYLALANLEIAAGRTGKAAEIVATAERNAVRDPALIVLRGRLQGQAGDVPKALASFEEAAALDPRGFDARVEQGHALYVLGKYAACARKFEEALILRPDDVALLKTLALLSMKEVPNARRARQCVDEIERLAPDDPDAAGLRAILALPP